MAKRLQEIKGCISLKLLFNQHPFFSIGGVTLSDMFRFGLPRFIIAGLICLGEDTIGCCAAGPGVLCRQIEFGSDSKQI